MTHEVTVEQFAKEREEGERSSVLDVREAHELGNSRLEPFVHIPLGELPDRIGELDPARAYVIVCRTGNRSGTATKFLAANGFHHVRNLVGGLNEWVQKIDPAMKVY